MINIDKRNAYNERLIDVIEWERPLWDLRDRNYKSRAVTDTAWRHVATVMGSTGLSRGDVVLIRWEGNNLVKMASTEIGVGKIEIVKKWSAAKKEYTDVECPQVIVEYNRHIGGHGQA
ncbi:hypothetical protein MRX96_025670 [Rhipicephalus microplus]